MVACWYVVSRLVLSATGAAALPADGDFTMEFLVAGQNAYSVSTLNKLPKEERDRYLSVPPEELERLCAQALWLDFRQGALTTSLKLFVAATNAKNVQARFAVRLLGRSSVYLGYFIQYYLPQEDQLLEWLVALRQASREAAMVPYNELDFSVLVGLCAELKGSPLAERAFWTYLAGKTVDEDEIASLRRDPAALRQFIDALYVGRMPPYLYWLYLNRALHEDTLRSLYGSISSIPWVDDMITLDDRLYGEEWLSARESGAATQSVYHSVVDRYYQEKWREIEESLQDQARAPLHEE